MKLSFVKIGVALLFSVFVIACTDNGSKPPPPGPDSTAMATNTDSLLQIFEFFTKKDSAHGIISYQREINNADDVDSLVDNYYKYASKKLGIDTTSQSNPRLSLAVDFEGDTLLKWMEEMYKAGATNIKISFGLYTPRFLNAYLRGTSLAGERQKREGRLTTILVAYKTIVTTKADGTKDVEEEFKGGYNLGGMQP